MWRFKGLQFLSLLFICFSSLLGNLAAAFIDRSLGSPEFSRREVSYVVSSVFVTTVISYWLTQSIERKRKKTELNTQAALLNGIRSAYTTPIVELRNNLELIKRNHESGLPITLEDIQLWNTSQLEIANLKILAEQNGWTIRDTSVDFLPAPKLGLIKRLIIGYKSTSALLLFLIFSLLAISLTYVASPIIEAQIKIILDRQELEPSPFPYNPSIITPESALEVPLIVSAQIGTNLGIFSDYSTEYVLVDAFKSSRPWITQSDTLWNTSESDNLDLDANGWVKSLPSDSASTNYSTVATIMFNSIGGNYPSGYYTILYEGEGTLEYGQDAQIVEAWSTPGRDFVNVTPSDAGILLKITKTNPDNYIRNIRVLMPGFNAADADATPFHPHFLASIEFYDVIRFLNWGRINNPINNESLSLTELEWSQRPLLTDARYSSDIGAPFELMIELANELEISPWIHIPHNASDEYVRQFADLVKFKLNKDLLVYIEYSNEIWVEGFGQNQWIYQQALAKWPEAGNSTILNWYAHRTKEICDIWKEAWEDSATNLICVVQSQIDDMGGAVEMLECPLVGSSPCAYSFDAIAIEPALGTEIREDTVEEFANGQEGFDAIFSILERDLSVTTQKIEDYQELSESYGLELISSSGGVYFPNYRMEDTSNFNFYVVVNEDERMKEIYDRALREWSDAGLSLFTHIYNTLDYSQYGIYGTQPYYDASNTPKYDALRNFGDVNE